MTREIAPGHTGGVVAQPRRERTLAELAARQHGVVARHQLLTLGFSRRAIDHRLDRGRLHPVHRGVYAVGHPRLTRRARWMAAVLACGSGAVLSHRAAAALHGIRSSGRLEVTVRRSRSPSPAITIHRNRLADDEWDLVDGIPVSALSRTLLDLAAVCPRREVERAAREAERLRLTDAVSLADLLSRHGARRGARTIRALVQDAQLLATPTRSELEALFLQVAREAKLPLPRTNALIEGRECDAVWETQRLIVELDSRTHHATASAFEADRARDRQMTSRGWRTVRLTWRQLTRERPAVVEDLRRLLATDHPAAGVPARGVEACRR